MKKSKLNVIKAMVKKLAAAGLAVAIGGSGCNFMASASLPVGEQTSSERRFADLTQEEKDYVKDRIINFLEENGRFARIRPMCDEYRKWLWEISREYRQMEKRRKELIHEYIDEHCKISSELDKIKKELEELMTRQHGKKQLEEEKCTLESKLSELEVERSNADQDKLRRLDARILTIRGKINKASATIEDIDAAGVDKRIEELRMREIELRDREAVFKQDFIGLGSLSGEEYKRICRLRDERCEALIAHFKDELPRISEHWQLLLFNYIGRVMDWVLECEEEVPSSVAEFVEMLLRVSDRTPCSMLKELLNTRYEPTRFMISGPRGFDLRPAQIGDYYNPLNWGMFSSCELL